MTELPINKEFIFIKQNYKNKDDYFEKMCQLLQGKEMIKEGYYQSIVAREEEYPTGLQVAGETAIAIPHTEYVFANTSQIVITTLKNKLKFQRMDDPSQEVEVGIIVHLLFNQPDKQPKMLKELMSIVADPARLAKIAEAESAEEIEEIFQIKEGEK